jgi:hypothetical protein
MWWADIDEQDSSHSQFYIDIFYFEEVQKVPFSACSISGPSCRLKSFTVIVTCTNERFDSSGNDLSLEKGI